MKVNKSIALQFLKGIKREPENFINPEAFSIDNAFIEKDGNLLFSTKYNLKELSGFCINSKDLHSISIISAAEGYQAAFSRGKYPTIINKQMNQVFKAHGMKIIGNFIEKAIETKINDFDSCWALTAECYQTLHTYFTNNNEPRVTFGVIQKWVNMSVKYCYTYCLLNDNLSYLVNCDFFKYACFPIDDYMEKILKYEITDIHFNREEFYGRDFPNKLSVFGWKQIDDLDLIYRFEKAVFEKVTSIGFYSLIEYEYEYWPIAAKFKNTTGNHSKYDLLTETVNDLDKIYKKQIKSNKR